MFNCHLPSVNATIVSLNLFRKLPGLHLKNLDGVLDNLNSWFGICFNKSERKSFHAREYEGNTLMLWFVILTAAFPMLVLFML